MNNFRKLTMLLFVAATIATFSACSEKENVIDDNRNIPSGSGSPTISEANLVGEWGWPSSHEMKNKTLVINADHTGAGNLLGSFNWTLDGKKFVGTSATINRQLEMTIKSINGDTMEVEGEYRLIDDDGNVLRVENNATGILVKTVTTQSPTLTESLMIGRWRFGDAYEGWDLIVNSDYTYRRRSSLGGTWSIDGSSFNCVEHSEGASIYPPEWPFSFTVETMTTSASKIVMVIRGGQNGDENIHGNLSRKL